MVYNTPQIVLILATILFISALNPVPPLTTSGLIIVASGLFFGLTYLYKSFKPRFSSLINHHFSKEAFPKPKINPTKKTFESVPIDNLVSKYKSPLFIISQRLLEDKLTTIRQLIHKHYQPVTLAYSVKTNNLSSLLAFYQFQGIHAEVVSGSEYIQARKIGFKKNIIFNGPDKGLTNLQTALKNGVKVNLDNQTELDSLLSLAKNAKRPWQVGIRVNTVSSQKSHFGFELFSGQALKAANQIISHPALSLAGLHLHLGSNLRSPRIYSANISQVIKFAQNLTSNHTLINYLDIGGGFPTHSSYQTHNSFRPYSLNSYLGHALSPIKNSSLNGIQVILEPGRLLIEEAVSLLTTVLSAQPEKKFIITDASLSTLPLATHGYQPIIQLNSHTHKEKRLTTIYGHTCMENDIIATTGLSWPISAGDSLIIHHVGAYNLTQSSSFIYPQPAVITINQKKISLSRNAQTPKDVINRDNL